MIRDRQGRLLRTGRLPSIPTLGSFPPNDRPSPHRRLQTACTRPPGRPKPDTDRVMDTEYRRGKPDTCQCRSQCHRKSTPDMSLALRTVSTLAWRRPGPLHTRRIDTALNHRRGHTKSHRELEVSTGMCHRRSSTPGKDSPHPPLDKGRCRRRARHPKRTFLGHRMTIVCKCFPAGPGEGKARFQGGSPFRRFRFASCRPAPDRDLC